jgi:alanyl-tRNA synthetase
LTHRLYRDDPYLLEFDATVVVRREHEGRPAVVLDRTAFYPESGGQPCDTGTLGSARVLAALEEGDVVLHVLDRPLSADRAHGRVDAERRRDHRQQHHGQHLLSRAFLDTASARTVAFHLGAELTTIDLDRPVTEDQVRAAEARTNEVVWEARPVRVRTVSAAEARSLGSHPPEGVDDVRLVEVEGYDVDACGGTHPRTTAEVGIVVITGTERHKGGTRVSFACGHRALDSIAQHQRVLDRLVSVLSAPVAQLADMARKTRDDLVALERRNRDLLQRALEGEARRLLHEAQRGETTLAPGGPPLIVAAYDGWPPADLRVLAQSLVAIAPCVALLGSRADKAHLVFAQSEGLPHDIPGLLKAAVESLGGRGGGRDNLAQGGGERLDLLDAALARAAGTVRSRM